MAYEWDFVNEIMASSEAALSKMFSCQGGLIWLDMDVEHRVQWLQIGLRFTKLNYHSFLILQNFSLENDQRKR